MALGAQSSVVGLPSARCVSQQIALDQADHGRADRRIERMLQIPDHMVGGEFVALGPFHALADLERPRLQVGRDLPALGEIGLGDVVVIGESQVFDDLTGHVGVVAAPGIGVRALDVLDARADAPGAALGQGSSARAGGAKGSPVISPAMA